MTKMATHPFTHKNLLLFLETFEYGLETWCEALGTRSLQSFLNDNPGMTLAYFKTRSNLVADVFESGHLVSKTSRNGPVF